MTADILNSRGEAAIAEGAILAFTNPAVGLGMIGAGVAAKATAALIAPGSGSGGGSSSAARASAPPPDLQGRLAGTAPGERTNSVNNFYFDGRQIAQTQEPHLRERGRLRHQTTPTTRRSVT